MATDPVSANRVNVFRQQTLVGTIIRTDSGAEFEYDEAFLRNVPPGERGIACHLPYERRVIRTDGVNLHPFFAGLLPEGLRLNALIQRTRTSADDLLSLLVAAEPDCVGDIYVSLDAEPSQPDRPLIDATNLEEAEFQELFQESIGGEAADASLPGVQDKISAAVISLPVRAKTGAAYILKLNPPKLPFLVENENFFLEMGADCGLDVAKAQIVKDRTGASGLLVERFDRYSPSAKRKLVRTKVYLTDDQVEWLRNQPGSMSGTLRGLIHADMMRTVREHQEDACQFLNRYPQDKYRLSMREVVEGIAQYSDAPRVDTLRLLHLYAFSYMIGNGDLHAKNISLYESHTARNFMLTPAYDLLSTLPYKGLHTMALRLDGRDDNFKRQNFVTFVERFGVNAKATNRMLDELYERSEPWIERIQEVGFDEERVPFIVETIRKRREEIVS